MIEAWIAANGTKLIVAGAAALFAFFNKSKLKKAGAAFMGKETAADGEPSPETEQPNLFERAVAEMHELGAKIGMEMDDVGRVIDSGCITRLRHRVDLVEDTADQAAGYDALDKLAKLALVPRKPAAAPTK